MKIYIVVRDVTYSRKNVNMTLSTGKQKTATLYNKWLNLNLIIVSV